MKTLWTVDWPKPCGELGRGFLIRDFSCALEAELFRLRHPEWREAL